MTNERASFNKFIIYQINLLQNRGWIKGGTIDEWYDSVSSERISRLYSRDEAFEKQMEREVNL